MNELLDMTVVQVFIGLFVWFLVGCGVLAAIDDKEKRLFNWAKSAPLPMLYELAVMAWPYILWLWWKDRRNAQRSA